VGVVGAPVGLLYSNTSSIQDVATYDFPQDLRDAQLRLHQTWAEYEALGRTLPWSVEPSEGWTGPKVLHADGEPRSLPPSPGAATAPSAAR
jgi:hypothetical protein